MKCHNLVLGIAVILLTAGCSPQGQLVPGVDVLNRNLSNPLVTPIWSPSGDHLAASYISYKDHQSTIYDYDLTTGKSKVLLSIEGEAVAQAWSRDETYLAVAISQSISFSDDGIWIFNLADGSNKYIGPGEAAVWSPDGSMLAIYSCQHLPDGKSSIATVRTVNLSQNDEEILFSKKGCFKLSYMSWSLDTTAIAFSFSEDKVTERPLDQIFVIDIMAKKMNKVSGEGSWSPSFSPDGEKIVYVKNDALRISDKTGTCQIEIGNLGIDIVGDVSWSPNGEKWAVSSLGKVFIIDIAQVMGEEFLGVNSLCQ